MKWFKHFTDAHDGNDLTKVRMKYGANGYAIYWYCLELIAGDLGVEENITFELKHDAQVIGFNLQIDQIKVEEIMNFMISLGLFERSTNNITCLKLAKYLDKKITRKKEIHQIIDAHKEILESQKHQKVSGTNGHLSGTNPDDPLRSPLELELELELDLDPIIKTKKFKIPTILEIENYLKEQNITCVNAEHFFNHYEANGWIRGKTKIKSWKACIRTWVSNNFSGANNETHQKSRSQRLDEELRSIVEQDLIENMDRSDL